MNAKYATGIEAEGQVPSLLCTWMAGSLGAQSREGASCLMWGECSRMLELKLDAY